MKYLNEWRFFLPELCAVIVYPRDINRKRRREHCQGNIWYSLNKRFGWLQCSRSRWRSHSNLNYQNSCVAGAIIVHLPLVFPHDFELCMTRPKTLVLWNAIAPCHCIQTRRIFYCFISGGGGGCEINPNPMPVLDSIFYLLSCFCCYFSFERASQQWRHWYLLIVTVDFVFNLHNVFSRGTKGPIKIITTTIQDGAVELISIEKNYSSWGW